MYTFHGMRIDPKNISVDPAKLSVTDTPQGVRSSIDDLIDEVSRVNSSGDPEAAMHRVIKQLRTSSDPVLKGVADNLDTAMRCLADVDMEGQTKGLVRGALKLLEAANERAKTTFVNAQSTSNYDGRY